MQGIVLSAAVAAAVVLCAVAWISRRKLRYRRFEVAAFDDIKTKARTGDIILFHKTSRNGLLDALELDVLSPLLFGETEFRHSGVIVKKDDGLFVVECADEFHSGHSQATYLSKGAAVRVVELETLLREYSRDNGGPHFGIKHIDREIPLPTLYAELEHYGQIKYLKRHKTGYVLFSHFFLPKALHQRIVHAYRNQMMCSEFIHSLLNRCRVLKDYPSKLFVPYYIENSAIFRKLEIAKYSDVHRFTHSRS